MCVWMSGVRLGTACVHQPIISIIQYKYKSVAGSYAALHSHGRQNGLAVLEELAVLARLNLCMCACVCVCQCECACVNASVCQCECVCVPTCLCVIVCVGVCLSTIVCVCVCVCVNERVHACVRVKTRVHLWPTSAPPSPPAASAWANFSGNVVAEVRGPSLAACPSEGGVMERRVRDLRERARERGRERERERGSVCVCECVWSECMCA